jgi:hypothetical protein
VGLPVLIEVIEGRADLVAVKLPREDSEDTEVLE